LMEKIIKELEISEYTPYKHLVKNEQEAATFNQPNLFY
jgi:hypothetical protein